MCHPDLNTGIKKLRNHLAYRKYDPASCFFPVNLPASRHTLLSDQALQSLYNLFHEQQISFTFIVYSAGISKGTIHHHSKKLEKIMKTRFNKKIATAVLAGLITISFIPMTANACRRGGGGQGGGCAMKGGQNGKYFGGALGVWRNTQAVKDLDLSTDQVNKLKNADFAAREKQQALWAEMDGLRLKMDHAFAAEKVNDDAVRKLSKQIAAVKGKMIELQTENRLILQNLLTPEQLDKLNSRRGGRGQGYGMKKNCMMNGQGGDDGMGIKKGQGRR